MTFLLKFTEDRTYIRIVDPENMNLNWGIISPTDGQIAVKRKLWELLDMDLRNSFMWADGVGRHGGVNYRCHCISDTTLGATLKHLDSFAKRKEFSFNLRLG